ncbi:MAG: aminotransferase class I/II-fold pyridoxal phosphate-dependent enzyme [Mogibacterium sp.]|nr:aminotransferase class I/II-fold pyridoxal phosphate-dependent enzyme [Mogibacterium sp.]
MSYNFDTTLDHRYDNSYRWVQPEGRDDFIGMGTADLDYECAPCIKEACRRVMEENTYNYRMRPDEYYDAICRFYKANYGLETDRSWFTHVPGTIVGIRIALSAFANKGDAVLMHSPAFGPLKATIELAGYRYVTNPLVYKDGRYEYDAEDFERKVRENNVKVFLLVNPHNPTGRAFTQAELESMVDICAANGVTIISDEVHSLVVFDGARHIPILAVSETARRISMQVISLSKGFNVMSIPHALYGIADPDLREKWMQEYLPYDFHYASNSYAIAVVTALLSGQADGWMAELTQYLKRNLDECLAFFSRDDIAGTAVVPEASFLVWVDLRDSGLDLDRLGAIFREEAGIDLNDGADFGPDGRGFVHINFAVTNAVLKEALSRMERVLKR